MSDATNILPLKPQKRLPRILQDVVAVNSKRNFYKIRARKSKKGGYLLYVDLRRKGVKKSEALNIYLSGQPADKSYDEQELERAVSIRNDMDKTFKIALQGSQGVPLEDPRGYVRVVDYFNKIMEQKSDKSNTYAAYRNCFKHLKNQPIGNQAIKKLNFNDCDSFWLYLRDLVHNDKISNNTAVQYFRILKIVFNKAVNADLLTKNPANKVHLTRLHEVETVFLTEDEVRLLFATPIKEYPQVRNAFLFGCLQGLRKSDIIDLQYKDIQNGSIHFRHKKSNKLQEIELHEQAREILDDQKNYSRGKFIFELDVGPPTLIRIIQNWAQAAGISEEKANKLVFHTSRHTFGCLLYKVTRDIYLVKETMGHSDIKTTLRYAKIIDSQVGEGIKKLPKF